MENKIRLMDTLMTIFAHQDDETFSAGGVLAKYGIDSKSWAVSVTKDDKRTTEFQEACQIIGTEGITLDYTSISSQNERKIIDSLIEIIREKQPDIIITHMDFDYHFEHRNLNSIVKEAVEWVSHTTSDKEAHQVKSLWAAETTILIPFPEIYIDISEENQLRLKAIACYESQSHKGGKGFYSEFHNKRTELRGIQSSTSHAEAFISIPIAKTGSFKPVNSLNKFP